MNFEEFSRELSNKRRYVSDLSRFISTRTDHNPNYTLLLGAGSSVSSGIRSASSLVDLWREELYKIFAGDRASSGATVEVQREFLKATQGNWYDLAREYSSLFEKRFDLQRQRRMFVEMEVAGKTPSIGYAYLTSLVEQNFFNTIFTTNFDDLLNEAFYLYSEQRPIVCAHDSSINSVTVTSKRPKIIKLHGDYLFDDLKSTVRETETLEQNMKAKFAEFSKDYGLIVVGYSGGDRSIMDVLSALLKNEEYLKNGVYWCLRKGAEVSEELRKLMWRDRVYFVEVDGFDELFAEFYSTFNKGDVLPANALTISHRPSNIAEKLLASENAFPSTSEILRKARERLERQAKRTTLVNLIVNPEPEANGRSLSNSDLGDEDLIVLMEIQNLISSDQYRQAIEKARDGLRAATSLTMKLRLQRLIIQAHQALGNTAEALAIAEEVISLQPKNSSHYLRKAAILKKKNERLQCIETAISVDPYSVDGYLDKARLLASWAEREHGAKKLELITTAREALDRGLELDPNWRNPCWREKFDLLRRHENDREVSKAQQGEIIAALRKQNPFTPRIFTMRQLMLSEKDDAKVFDGLLADIEEGRERANIDSAIQFEVVRLRVLAKLGDEGRLEAAISALQADEKLKKEPALAIAMASILREKLGRDSEAKAILRTSLSNDFDGDVMFALFEIYVDLKDYAEANELVEKWQRKLSSSMRHRLLYRRHEARGEFEDALREISRYEQETGLGNASQVIYLNLRLGRFSEAEKIARAVLEPINYSLEAVQEIVNLELARKKLNKKVNIERLTNVMKVDQSPETSAAVFSLLEKRAEMLESIKNAMREDKTFRFEANEWPVFETCRGDADFARAVSV